MKTTRMKTEGVTLGAARCEALWCCLVWLLYVALAVLYFLPLSVPYKIAYPVALLSLVAWLRRPWMVALAMTCGCVGDLMGALGNFPAQLSAFAVGHILLATHFLRLAPRGAWQRHKPLLALCVGLLAVVAALVLPGVPWAWLQGAVMFYAVVILAMLFGAACWRGGWLLVGAALFVLSDFVLGYNRFVAHLPYASWLIMVPYYSAQLTILLASGDQIARKGGSERLLV